MSDAVEKLSRLLLDAEFSKTMAGVVPGYAPFPACVCAGNFQYIYKELSELPGVIGNAARLFDETCVPCKKFGCVLEHCGARSRRTDDDFATCLEPLIKQPNRACDDFTCFTQVT